jgi:hypothetical protein
MELANGAIEGVDTFFLAMAHWQLGEKDKARRWYDRAVKWLDKNKDQVAGAGGNLRELNQFHAEAAVLLGIKSSLK